MSREQPATDRQRERMRSLGIAQWDDDLTLEEAAEILRAKIRNGAGTPAAIPHRILNGAMAVNSEGDDRPGQWGT